MANEATTLYPFLPSGRDFAAALAFFADLGFETVWNHSGMAGLRFGGAYFILQDIDIPVWQENQMVTFEVPDLDAYWEAISTKPNIKKMRAPTDFPWGREAHIIDPGGICWHIRQSKP